MFSVPVPARRNESVCLEKFISLETCLSVSRPSTTTGTVAQEANQRSAVRTGDICRAASCAYLHGLTHSQQQRQKGVSGRGGCATGGGGGEGLAVGRHLHCLICSRHWLAFSWTIVRAYSSRLRTGGWFVWEFHFLQPEWAAHCVYLHFRLNFDGYRIEPIFSNFDLSVALESDRNAQSPF